MVIAVYTVLLGVDFFSPICYGLRMKTRLAVTGAVVVSGLVLLVGGCSSPNAPSGPALPPASSDPAFQPDANNNGLQSSFRDGEWYVDQDIPRGTYTTDGHPHDGVSDYCTYTIDGVLKAISVATDFTVNNGQVVDTRGGCDWRLVH